MHLVKLQIRGFMSLVNVTINFERGLWLLDGFNHDDNSSNGAGKSNIIDALCFVLYGKTPREATMDEVLNWDEPNKGCEISLTFMLGNATHIIRRTRIPNNLEYFIDGELVKAANSTELQKTIITNIGISYDTFVKTSYYPQNTSLADEFLFVKDSVKKEILTELLKLEKFDRCLKAVKDMTDRTNIQLSAIRSDITIKTTMIDDRGATIEKLVKASQTFEETIKVDLAACDKRIQELEEMKNVELGRENEIISLSADIAVIEENLSKRIEEQPKLSEQLKKLEIEKYNLSEKVAYAKANLDHLKADEAKFKELGEVCPTCTQKVNKDMLYKIQADIGGQIEPHILSLESLVDQYDRLVDEYNVTYTALDAHKVTTQQINSSLQSKKMMFEQMTKRKKEQLEYISKDIETHKENKKAVAARKNEYNAMIQTVKDEISSLNSALIKLGSDESAATKILAAMNELSTIFGRNGIKAVVFATALKELETWTNHFLSDMFNDGIIISLGQSESTSIRDGISIKVSKAGHNVPIKLLSGGEKRKLILSLNFAMSKIVSTRASNVPNFLFMDECFDGLDDHGKAKIMKFLDVMKSEKDFIFVIDHGTEFKGMFNGTYMIEKRNGVSSLAA